MPFLRGKSPKIEIVVKAKSISGKEKYECKLSKESDDDNLAKEYSEILSVIKGKGFS